jgi:uncharacterized protein (DUF2267 family)
MQTQDIVGALAARLDVPEPRADTTLKATLTALGRALPSGEATDAASQLPAEVADPLRTAALQPVEDDVEVLLADVAERLDTDGDGARDTVGAVLGVLQEALDQGEWTELTNVLPTGILELTRA